MKFEHVFTGHFLLIFVPLCTQKLTAFGKEMSLKKHMVHDLGWVILSLFSVTVLQVLHGVTQYQWHILVT